MLQCKCWDTWVAVKPMTLSILVVLPCVMIRFTYDTTSFPVSARFDVVLKSQWYDYFEENMSSAINTQETRNQQ